MPLIDQLEQELRDAWEGQGNKGVFLIWLEDMAENNNGTLQWAAKEYLRRVVMEAKGLHEYAFDITLAGAIRVRAKSEAEARELLDEKLCAAMANMGTWPDGSPILCEVSIWTAANDGFVPTLTEIDGDYDVDH